MSGHRCLRAGGESLRPLQTGSGLGTGRGHKPGRWSALTRECEHTGEEGGREGEREKGRRGYWSASCPLSSPETARKRATGKSFYTSLVSRDTVFVMLLKGYYPPKEIIYHQLCLREQIHLFFQVLKYPDLVFLPV